MILVTGATGFLGSHLCASLLEKGYDIRACRRETSSMTEFETILKIRLGDKWPALQNKVEWAYAEVNDYESLRDAMEGVKAVFHVAAIVSFWSRRKNEMFRVNVEGTANVVNAALETGVPYLIHSSSIAALGRDGKTENIDETSEWIESRLNSAYAISKHLAEMEVWRGREEGLKASMVNPGVILGEGNWDKGSCRLLYTVLEGKPFYTSSTNGYVDVLDVAEAMIQIYEREIDGERFVLVGESLPSRNVFTLGASLHNRPEPRWEVKPWMLEIAWRLLAVPAWFSGKEPMITRDTAKTATHHYTYSSEKAQKELGIQFSGVEAILKRVFPLVCK